LDQKTTTESGGLLFIKSNYIKEDRKLTLYHGSPIRFEHIDISRAKEYRDFGKGFYLAEQKIDAISMSIKNSDLGYVYTYELDEADLLKYKVLKFNGFSKEWFDFIVGCRTIKDYNRNYDVIIGQMATGDIKKYFNDIRNKSVTYKNLKKLISGGDLGIQYLIKNTDLLNKLKLVDISLYEREH
jgi:hypothetical protein